MLADEDLPELDPPSSENPTMEPDEPESSGSSPTESTRGVVVVRERPRSRLMGLLPPFLILLAALAILTLRIRSPDWQGWTPSEKSRPTAQPAPAASTQAVEAAPSPTQPETEAEANADVDVEASEPEPGASEALAEESSPFSDPKPERTAKAEVEREVESPRPSMPDGKPLNLTAELYRPLLSDVDANAAVEKPDPRRVQAELQREAKAKADDRQRLADLKPKLQEQDQAQAKQQKADREARQFQDGQERRNLFLDELRQALQGDRANAADAIRRLARIPVGEPIPMSPTAIERARSLALSRNQRQAWIVEARSQGIEESAILGDLALAHLVNVVARSGPRTDDEALILASRELISVPTDLTASAVAPHPLHSSPNDGPASQGGTSRFGASSRRR